MQFRYSIRDLIHVMKEEEEEKEGREGKKEGEAKKQRRKGR